MSERALAARLLWHWLHTIELAAVATGPAQVDGRWHVVCTTEKPMHRSVSVLWCLVLSQAASAFASESDSGVAEGSATSRTRVLIGLGGATTGVGTTLAARFESWQWSTLAWGVSGGTVLASGAAHGPTRAVFAGPTLSFRDSPAPRHWLAAATLGAGYAEVHDAYCSDDISWNEGYCNSSDWEGVGPYLGLLLGPTGRLGDGEVGLFLNLDYIPPEFAFVALNVGWAW